MKKIIALIITLILLTSMFVSCNDEDANLQVPVDGKEEEAVISETPTDLVLIDVKDYGKMIVELYPDVAPITVANFKKLVSEKFYDGLIFHRIYEGFMIQGGGFTEDYQEKEAAEIKGEFSNNGIENNLLHTRGVISMARTSVMDSASSQFFIMHQDYPSLDGSYAAFGKLIQGFDVLDAIATSETSYNAYGEKSVPVKNVVINSIRFLEIKK